MISNQIDFLAGDSFHTVHRGSLQIVPDFISFDYSQKNEEDVTSTLKSSYSSHVFEDQDN
jgi:hypothetical protein